MEQFAIYDIENEIIEEQTSGGFIIDNDNAAEWAIKKISETRAELARYEMVCQNAISVYQMKMADARDKAHRETNGLEGMLRSYFEQVPHKATKTQETYKLPSGTLKLKRGGIEYVRDEEALLPWVKENAPDMVKVKESVDWAGLKATVSVSGSSVVDESGEKIPGVTVVEKPDTFTVDL
jgi:hypothetical protein